MESDQSGYGQYIVYGILFVMAGLLAYMFWSFRSKFEELTKITENHSSFLGQVMRGAPPPPKKPVQRPAPPPEAEAPPEVEVDDSMTERSYKDE